MISNELIYALGFIALGIICAAPVAYLIGKTRARRECDAAWDHVDNLHQALGHKSYIVLRPQISARRLK